MFITSDENKSFYISPTRVCVFKKFIEIKIKIKLKQDNKINILFNFRINILMAPRQFK